MLTQDEHAQTALEFLEKADRHYADGDQIQASEKLWGAAAQAIMAVSMERGWPHTSHPAMTALPRTVWRRSMATR